MAQRYLQTNVKNYQDSIGSHFYSKPIRFKTCGAIQAVPQPPARNTKTSIAHYERSNSRVLLGYWGELKWAIQVSNQGHPACKAGALPLS